MRNHALSDINTQTRLQINHVFAFLNFSSSPQEIISISPLIMSAITAAAATNFMSSDVNIFANLSKGELS
jgi:hypothetical protein